MVTACLAPFLEAKSDSLNQNNKELLNARAVQKIKKCIRFFQINGINIYLDTFYNSKSKSHLEYQIHFIEQIIIIQIQIELQDSTSSVKSILAMYQLYILWSGILYFLNSSSTGIQQLSLSNTIVSAIWFLDLS